MSGASVEDDTGAVTTQQKLSALYEVAKYRPGLAAGILGFGAITAVLEGIGLSFIMPIIQQAQGDGSEPSGMVAWFARAYEIIGVPFTLEYIVAGVGVIMAVRYAASFGVQYLRGVLEIDYIRHLRTQTFDHALDARVEYFDEHGSDEILNAIITQTRYAGRAIRRTVRLLKLSLISMTYLAIALVIAPVLTVLTAAVMGVIMIGIRQVLEGGFDVGERVAEANERVQETVQAGMQGIREVKLFNVGGELFAEFEGVLDRWSDASIDRRRNQAAIRNLNQFATAVTVFVLIYLGLEVFALSLGSLGVFLFAMFRLGPKVSNINDTYYMAETDLPHLVRTHAFLDTLRDNAGIGGGERPVPDPVERIAFEDVSFEYNAGEETVLDGVSFEIQRGEFAGFVGSSGAGKSTIVSLLARLYEPDEGCIRANGTRLDEFDVAEWRSRVSVVRQNPFIFNDTLRQNLTVGNRDATQAEIERAAEIAQVTEFTDSLPQGYDTVLGDDGVRLSGGQRQRVAIARALLKDADLLVLDEATSDLDTHLEEKVHSAIESMERDYAMIAIAHRISTVTDADRIYSMSDGRIVEAGPHRELVQNDGAYASLYGSQS